MLFVFFVFLFLSMKCVAEGKYTVLVEICNEITVCCSPTVAYFSLP